MRTIAYMLSLVFIFIIPWEGIIEFPGMGTAAKLIGLAVAGFWVAAVVMSGRLRKPGVFQITVCLFVVWNAVSIYWSADVMRTLGHVVTWIQLLGLVFIMWDLYTARSDLLAGLQAYVLGAYVAIGSAVANFLAGNAFYSTYQRFSPAEQTNPDGFGFILALGIPVAWYLASSPATTKMNRLLKLLNYTYIPAAFLGITLSGTRTAIIAAVPAMAFGLSTLIRLKPVVRVAIFLLLMSAVLVLLPHVQALPSFQRFSTIGSEITEGDLNVRTVLWREGLAAFAERPFLGVGSNMYRSVNSLSKLAHNSFLSVLVELGPIGFLLFATILVIAIIQAWGQPRWDSRFWLTTLMVWAIGASSLTYEHRKATWLFLTLLIASAGLTRYQDKSVALIQHNEPEAQEKI